MFGLSLSRLLPLTQRRRKSKNWNSLTKRFIITRKYYLQKWVQERSGLTSLTTHARILSQLVIKKQHSKIQNKNLWQRHSIETSKYKEKTKAKKKDVDNLHFGVLWRVACCHFIFDIHFWQNIFTDASVNVCRTFMQ